MCEEDIKAQKGLTLSSLSIVPSYNHNHRKIQSWMPVNLMPVLLDDSGYVVPVLENLVAVLTRCFTLGSPSNTAFMIIPKEEDSSSCHL